jgi:hypothetical protein
MSWLWLALYFVIGFGVGFWTFWPYRGHSLMRGAGLPAAAGLVAAVWPLWLLSRAWDWIVRRLDRD